MEATSILRLGAALGLCLGLLPSVKSALAEEEAISITHVMSFGPQQGYCAYEFVIASIGQEMKNVEIAIASADGSKVLGRDTMRVAQLGGPRATWTARARAELLCGERLEINRMTASIEGKRVDVTRRLKVDRFKPLPLRVISR